MAKPQEFTYNYQVLSRLSGMKMNSLHQAKCRGDFDPEDLESVVIWLARHGKASLRRRMINYALERILPEKPGRRGRKKPTRKRGS